MRAYEGKIIRYETSLDQLNRKLRDHEEYISKMERNLGEKQQQLHKKDQEKEKQLRKFNSKIAEENDRKHREMEFKLSEQKRKMEDQVRSQEEKLRLVTEIVNGEDVPNRPVSNLIQRFNSNCENSQPPGSERKARPRVSLSILLIFILNLKLTSIVISGYRSYESSSPSLQVCWQ